MCCGTVDKNVDSESETCNEWGHSANDRETRRRTACDKLNVSITDGFRNYILSMWFVLNSLVKNTFEKYSEHVFD